MASMTNALATDGTFKPNSSVVDTVNQITNQDSPLMQQAAATANRQASRSGLMNSSLAVGAAQGAVTQQAADLAKAEVSANQGQQQINNQSSQYDRSQTEAERASKIAEDQGQQQISAQDRQWATQFNANNAQFQQQFGLQQQQVTNQANQFQQSLSLETQKMQEQSKQFSQSIQANVRGSYTDAANNLLNNSSVNINNIASNASITKADKDKLIAQELANRNNDLAYLQTMYSGVTSWANSL